jgi:isopenicillin N synthase-like dioxygenase
MADPTPVPLIDVGALSGPPSAARDALDRAIAAAAHEVGFLIIVALPPDVPVGTAARARLLRIFDLEPAVLRALWRRQFEPRNRNVYRGWFPAQSGHVTAKEGIDLGPDLLYGTEVIRPADPLCEPTPLPDEGQLPGWRALAADYYAAMERLCQSLMHAIARSLALPENFFDAAFERGLSTLRLLRYPPRSADDLARCQDEGLWTVHAGQRRHLAGAAHTDSGFLTVLAQDGVPGLQARTAGGDWIDVPALEQGLAVNFGQVLERWSGGRIRATEHRVLGAEQVRCSIPFFYEARADACIGPLPADDPSAFAPFLYGDYLWERIVSFVEFRGLQRERDTVGA